MDYLASDYCMISTVYPCIQADNFEQEKTIPGWAARVVQAQTNMLSSPYKTSIVRLLIPFITFSQLYRACDVQSDEIFIPTVC